MWYSNNYSRRVHILISASSFKNKNSDQTTEDRENQWTHSHSHIHTNKQKSFKCATAARSAHFSISFEGVSVYEVKESCCWFLSSTCSPSPPTIRWGGPTHQWTSPQKQKINIWKLILKRKALIYQGNANFMCDSWILTILPSQNKLLMNLNDAINNSQYLQAGSFYR